MALVKCTECGADISDKAESCPSCGVKIKKKTSFMTKFSLFLIFLILVAFSLPSVDTGTKEPINNFFDKAYTGAERLKSGMIDPNSVTFVKVVSTPESSICYDFTTKNSLGGAVRMNAVFSKDNTTLIHSEQKGFDSVWDSECQNKSGEQIHL